jgi:SAM-dependent methyltransferase
MMFFRRNYSREIMDDFSIKDERIDIALKELNIINSFLGGNHVSEKAIILLNRGYDSTSILDIGAGASDILLKLNRNGNHFDIFSLDINPRACFYSASKSPEVKTVCGDVRFIPFKKQVDIIHASLFFHHFREEEIIKIISGLLALSKRGIVINDLRRSLFAWLGITILTYLFSKSELVKNDGPLSVKRGFIKSDLTKILDTVSPGKYEIRRMWAFRWMIVIYK